MYRFFDKIFGHGYEMRMLENGSIQSTFLLLLMFVFFLGLVLDGALVSTSDRWFFAFMATIVFRDARVVYRTLGRVLRPQRASLPITGNNN